MLSDINTLLFLLDFVILFTESLIIDGQLISIQNSNDNLSNLLLDDRQHLISYDDVLVLLFGFYISNRVVLYKLLRLVEFGVDLYSYILTMFLESGGFDEQWVLIVLEQEVQLLNKFMFDHLVP